MNTRIASSIVVGALAAPLFAQEILELPSQVRCPLCAAGGYGAGNSGDRKWVFNTVIAPTTETRAESFLWYQVDRRTQVGLGFLWRQSAFRVMGSYQLLPETSERPSLNAFYGVQGVGQGNPGFSLTTEKNFDLPDGKANAYIGVGFRTNEDHGHFLIGAKYAFPSGLTLGVQHDGHQTNPFAIFNKGDLFGGLYLIDFKSPAPMFGIRF